MELLKFFAESIHSEDLSPFLLFIENMDFFKYIFFLQMVSTSPGYSCF